MKVSKKIREKRINDIRKLYNLIIADNQNAKEELYKLLKKEIKDNTNNAAKESINFIEEVLTKNLSTTLSELKKIYSKSFDSKKVLNLQEIFYDADGKTFKERIENWFKEILHENPSQDEILILFYHLGLIIDTESFKIISYSMQKKLNTEYVEIIAGEGCDTCNEYCDGEVHLESEIELPPYHPNCLCETIYFEKEDIIEDL
jgi:hypothetical protein